MTSRCCFSETQIPIFGNKRRDGSNHSVVFDSFLGDASQSADHKFLVKDGAEFPLLTWLLCAVSAQF